MLTYKLHGRFCKIEKHKRLHFPNNVLIEVLLSPGDQFGIGGRPRRTARKGSHAGCEFSLNTGKQIVVSTPPLELIEVAAEDLSGTHHMRYQVKGNVISVTTRCDTEAQLNRIMATLYVLIPLVLNIELDDPVCVSRISGKVGPNSFNWEYDNLSVQILPTTKETQQQRVMDSLNAIPHLTEDSNARLLAASQYLYNASRLIETGNTPFEFLAEAILNLSKCLEILFGQSRDTVREELEKLGFTADDTERLFLPIMVLRSEFDVAHVSINLHSSKELIIIYEYLNGSVDRFRALLKKVLAAINDGSYTMREWQPSADGEKRRVMAKLVSNMLPVVAEELIRAKKIPIPHTGKR